MTMKSLQSIATLGLVASLGPARAEPPASSIACHISALSAAERRRHGELLARLSGAVWGHESVTDGLVVAIDRARAPLAAVSEWMELEARCCPFIEFGLELRPQEAMVRLHLGGGPGVKALLEAQFGAFAGAPHARAAPAAAESPPASAGADARAYVGQTIRVRYDDGDAMLISYPSADQVKWIGTGGRCRDERGHAQLRATQIASGVWFFHWVEDNHVAVSQVVDWSARTIVSHSVWAGPAGLQTRVHKAAFEPTGGDRR